MRRTISFHINMKISKDLDDTDSLNPNYSLTLSVLGKKIQLITF